MLPFILTIVAILTDPSTGQELIRVSRAEDTPNFEDFKKLDSRTLIHKFEGAVLGASEETNTQISEQFLSMGSQNLVNEEIARLNYKDVEVKETTYSILLKYGMINPAAHKLKQNNKTIFDTSESFYEKKGPREKWFSARIEDFLIFSGTRLSDRDTSECISRAFGPDNSIKPTTVGNRLERYGTEIGTIISNIVEEALSPEYINAILNRQQPDNFFSEDRYFTDPNILKAVAESLKIKNYNPADYEAPDVSANISVDDICVKAQKPMRPMPEGKEKKKRVYNSIAHFDNQDGKYSFSGDGMAHLFRRILGFMAYNNNIDKQPIVFFTDGAKNIHDEIQKTFKFTRYKIILDWYHLSKKFRELFSMAFRGKKISEACHKTIMSLLWVGDVDGAIKFMANADSGTVKNQIYLKQLTDYLNRVRDFIPIYALRKQLGLRIGSGIVETTNNLLVAKRQKHNGMSWSKEGSMGLAAVTCAFENDEIEGWTQKRVIQFRPVPHLELAA